MNTGKVTPNVIFIDDDHSFMMICLLLIKQVLKEVDVKSFYISKEALEYFETEFSLSPYPVMVFLDINMPEYDGWDILDRLNGFSDEIKEKMEVFILSSSVYNEDKEKAGRYSLVKGYIEKPLSREKLENVLL